MSLQMYSSANVLAYKDQHGTIVPPKKSDFVQNYKSEVIPMFVEWICLN